MDKAAARAWLDSLAGEWSGTNRTWFEPDVLADESPITATVRVLPGGSSAVYEYDAVLQGKPFRGVALIAFNTFTGRFDGAWVDSFHMSTNLMVSHGGGEGGCSLLGSYQDPGGGPAWGWRTVFELSGVHLTVTAFNITPAGDEARAVEARYVRAR